MIIRLLLLFSLSLVIVDAGFAQTNEAEIRYYDVEVIIFKNLRGPKGKELILPLSSPLKDKTILDLSSPESITAAAEKSYQLLASEQLQLHDQVEKIEKSPYYELLAHLGWRQPGLEKGKAMPVWIRAGREFGNEYISMDSHVENLANSDANEFSDNSSGTDNTIETALPVSVQQTIYELEGKITITLSRYLHTYADLVLRRPRLSLEQTLENPEQAQWPQTNIADTRILNNHSLKEHRRMRSKSLHYLDNPEFSLLILITPFIPDENGSAMVQ